MTQNKNEVAKLHQTMTNKQNLFFTRLHGVCPDASAETVRIACEIFQAVLDEVNPQYKRRTASVGRLAGLVGRSPGWCRKQLDDAGVPFATTKGGHRRYETARALYVLNA